MTTRPDGPTAPETGRNTPGGGTRRRYAPSTRESDLALLAAGIETGWCDEHGDPAPWPEDFFLADGTINPDWQPSSGPNAEPRQPPF